MRVLLVLTGAYGEPGGIEAYNRLAIRAFGEFAAREGGECEALILNDRGATAGRPEPGVTTASFGRRKGAFARSVLARVAKSRPTLIFWGHVNFAPLAALCAPIAPSARRWFAIHGIDAWHRLPAIHRAVLKRVDRIVAVSDFTRRTFAASNGIGSDRVDLLPCALDPYFGSERTSPPAFGHLSSDSSLLTPHALTSAATHSSMPSVFLTVTRLSRADGYKGVDEVLRALPEVAKRIAGARYVVVGDGDDRPRLEALASELGVKERVEFRGKVSARELADAYRECSLFVLPSSGEGFGIVFLEAAHFGKPSIAGGHGGSPEIVLDGVTGRVVEKGETERLAAAIAEMLGDPERAARMGRAARERVEKLFSYESFKERLAELIGASVIPANAGIALSEHAGRASTN